MDREQELRERAYRIWEEEGRLNGNDREHWLRAKQQHEDRARDRGAADRVRHQPR